MTDSPLRPWLDLYQGVPPTIEPKATTALDMFRATLQRRPGAPPSSSSMNPSIV